MNCDRAVAILDTGTEMPLCAHSAAELDEACELACDALRFMKSMQDMKIPENVSEAVQHFERYIGNDCYTEKFQSYCRMAIIALRYGNYGKV